MMRLFCKLVCDVFPTKAESTTVVLASNWYIIIPRIDEMQSLTLVSTALKWIVFA